MSVLNGLVKRLTKLSHLTIFINPCLISETARNISDVRIIGANFRPNPFTGQVK